MRNNRAITITFRAPGAEQAQLERCQMVSSGVWHRTDGDDVIFVLKGDRRSGGRSYRQHMLNHAAVLHALLPENAELKSFGPSMIDGQDAARGLKVSPSALSAVGVDIFRRSANDVSTIFEAIGELRSNGHEAAISDSLRDDLSLSADANRLNGQISRGLSARLLAEGGADVGGTMIPGIGEIRIIDEGHMAHISSVILDDNLDQVRVTCDGATVHAQGSEMAISARTISVMSALIETSSEILRDEKSRFNLLLREWASDPVSEKTPEGEVRIRLGRWDGTSATITVSPRGEVFPENLPFSFPSEIFSQDDVMEIFGEGPVLKLVRASIDPKMAA